MNYCGGYFPYFYCCWLRRAHIVGILGVLSCLEQESCFSMLVAICLSEKIASLTCPTFRFSDGCRNSAGILLIMVFTQS